MSDLELESAVPSEAKLHLTLRNQNPIASDDLGTLFTALAKDYARINRGRTLMVYELRAGSLVAVLVDAAAVVGPMAKDMGTMVEAAGAIHRFGSKLFSVLDRAKANHGGVFDNGRKRNGQASAEALLRIAIESDAEVSIKQTSSSGDLVEMKVMSLEAMRIREGAKTDRYRLGRSQVEPLLADQSNRLYRTDDLARSVLAITGPSGVLNDEARRAIIAMIKGLSESGFGIALTALAASLDRHGRTDIADLVRKHQDGA